MEAATTAYPECEMSAEREAIVACQRGARDAFGVIVEVYRRRAYVAAVGLLGNREDALDALQDAFVRAYRAIRRFDPDRPFYPWFLRILKNLCFDRLRRRRALSAGEMLDGMPGRGPGPEVLARRDEARERVWAAIRRLPARDREILVLRHFQHLSYREIAATLDIPQGTVMSRLFTARSRLREEVGEEPAED